MWFRQSGSHTFGVANTRKMNFVFHCQDVIGCMNSGAKYAFSGFSLKNVVFFWTKYVS
jgi:hypothetical protein